MAKKSGTPGSDKRRSSNQEGGSSNPPQPAKSTAEARTPKEAGDLMRGTSTTAVDPSSRSAPPAPTSGATPAAASDLSANGCLNSLLGFGFLSLVRRAKSVLEAQDPHPAATPAQAQAALSALRREGHANLNTNIRPVVLAGAALVTVAVAGRLILGLALGTLIKAQTAADVPASPLVATPQVPPSPRLQESPGLDMLQFQRQEDEYLNSYGYVDQNHTIVHIPISQAIDSVLQKGLPTLPASQAAQNSAAPPGTSK